jgi:hypothetical protein
MTNSFTDFHKAKMFLVIVSNMTEAHPVAATFVKDAVLDGAQLIVVDPRKTGLADFAQLHVPIKEGKGLLCFRREHCQHGAGYPACGELPEFGGITRLPGHLSDGDHTLCPCDPAGGGME